MSRTDLNPLGPQHTLTGKQERRRNAQKVLAQRPSVSFQWTQDMLEMFLFLRTYLFTSPLVYQHVLAIPAKGHDDIIANTDNYAARQEVLDTLTPSENAGKLINRAPFYWSGGLGTLIRKSADEIKKNFVWDFFVYTNSPATSKYDVANYASWLDSWRYSQLFPGDNFLDGGWSEDSYEEHAAVMNWALSTESNGALNLRIPVSTILLVDIVCLRSIESFQLRIPGEYLVFLPFRYC